MPTIQPVDTSSFTPSQLTAFQNAAKLGSGVPTYNSTASPIGPAPKTPTGTTQPTVVTSANINETVVPKLKSDLQRLTANATDTQGNRVLIQDPSINQDRGFIFDDPQYNTALGKTSSTDAAITIDPAEQAILDQMKSVTDASTKRLIDSIQSNYANLKTQQADVNKRAEAGTEQALLMGGSSRYAPISSEGIQQAQVSYGLQKVQALENEEQGLIAQAESARDEKNYQLLETKLGLISEKRKEKQAEAKKLADDLAAQNTAIREQQKAASLDQSIADLYGKGTTDATSIFNALRQAGDTTTTLKDVSESLKNIVPAGLDDLVKTLRTNGAPAEVLQSVLSSKDMNAAYKAAGNYAAGGTGIIGEYNYYKAQAESKGLVAMDFNEYQNVDANRKAKVAAAANAAGLTSALTNVALRLSDDYEQQSKNFYTVRDAYSRIQSSAENPSAAGDMSLIFAYMKILDPNSVVRETEYATAQNAGSIPERVRAAYNSAVDGKKLSEAQRNDFVDRAGTIFTGAKKQQDAVAKEFETRAGQYGVPANLVVRDTSAAGLVDSEIQAKNSVIDYGKSHPDKQAQILDLVTSEQPDLGRPYTYEEVLQILNP